MKRIKRKIYHRCFTVAAMVSICFLTGCADTQKENEAAYRKTGIECMEQGDYAGAIEAFDLALQQCIGTVTADAVDISYYKAAAQYAKGDIKGAMATYDALIDFNNELADAYYLRGCLYIKQENAKAAQADFSNAVKYNKNDYELYFNIYEMLFKVGQTEEAEAFLNQAFTIKGNEVKNLEYRGKLYFLLGEYENAITELTAALKKKSTLANYYLGEVYHAKGDEEQAELYFDTYLASAPNDPHALNAVAELMIEKEQYEQAISYLNQALTAEGVINKQRIMKNLTIAYEYSRDFEQAWELIQEYVVLFPEDEQAQREYIFLKNRQMKTEVTSE